MLGPPKSTTLDSAGSASGEAHLRDLVPGQNKNVAAVASRWRESQI